MINASQRGDASVCLSATHWLSDWSNGLNNEQHCLLQRFPCMS